MTVNIKRYWVIPRCNHPQLHCGREGGGKNEGKNDEIKTKSSEKSKAE